jgi:glucosamine 6-phosphate synthetase-like amidotransferase/phosphosugar isomerase protein
MCGIIGSVIKAQNGFFNGDVKTVEELLYIDALRGPDSTGLACFYNDGEMQLVKQASEAAWFRCEKEYDAVFKKLVSKGKAVIGHNRKKTVGKIDHDSAHPFAINYDEKEVMWTVRC